MEEFAHINGWEAYPEEDGLTDKTSSKTSSRVSTPVAEVDSKKAEPEVVKAETKPEKKDQGEEIKPEPMEVDKEEAGMEGIFKRVTAYPAFYVTHRGIFSLHSLTMP